MNLPRYRLIVMGILVILVLGGLWFRKASRSGIQSLTDGARAAGEQRVTSALDRNTAERAPIRTRTKPAVLSRHELLLGGTILPVIFQDTTQPTLSDAERLEAIADFQMIYGHLDLSESYDIPPKVMTAGGGEITISKMAYATGPGQHFPEPHMNTFGQLSGAMGSYRLVVPIELMTAYRSAFDFREANREAFESLDSFLPAGDPGSLQTFGMSLADLIWTRSPSTLTPEMGERILQEVGLIRVRRPSILEYFKVGGDDNSFGLPGLPDGTIVGIAMQIQDGNIPKQPVVLVYIEGRWKIGIAPFGT